MRKLQGQSRSVEERKQRCVLTASSALFPFFGSLSEISVESRLLSSPNGDGSDPFSTSSGEEDCVFRMCGQC